MKPPHEMRPGNRYARAAEARKTLGTLISRKAALIAICQRCKHRRLLFPRQLANRLGEGFKVADLPKRLRCQSCGFYGSASIHESTR
jgi:DNA-directed RNA polymerase subunit RPC12/RpoP